MIRSFKNKGLRELFERGTTRRINRTFHRRLLRRLDALDVASELPDLNVPGFDFHGLKGKPKRFSIHVNGPWCLTFEWEDGDAKGVEFEQYH